MRHKKKKIERVKHKKKKLSVFSWKYKLKLVYMWFSFSLLIAACIPVLEHHLGIELLHYQQKGKKINSSA